MTMQSSISSEETLNNKRPIEAEHHQQLELCKTRPAYRQGRKLTAVKVYTISSESSHLFIYGVPKINLRSELKKLCSDYGKVLSIVIMENYKTEMFTECYHIHYQRIQSARIAKRFLDNRSFYGGILHVCYAPEFESVDETKQKLWQRTKDVMSRLYPNNRNFQFNYKNEHINNSAVSTLPIDPLLMLNFPEVKDSSSSNINKNSEPPAISGSLPQPNDSSAANNSISENKRHFNKLKQIPSHYLKDLGSDNSFVHTFKRTSKFVPRQVSKKRKIDYV